MSWKILNKHTVLETVPFRVEELQIEQNGQRFEQPYHKIVCPDWVNVLPITKNGQAVLIRQMRAGSENMELEIPGGVIDDIEKKDPTLAALRELEEETGYHSSRLLPLASLNPNPAIQSNTVHLFVALDCELNADRKHFPDAEEEISISLHNLSDLDQMIRTGQINHSLCCLCILLARKYVAGLN